MQPIGERQIQQLREATERRVAGDKSQGAAQDFKIYARRLVKDLELKGTIRTAVEGVNLSLHWHEADILAAECIRTFRTVTFPATLLLKREEAETNKLSGVQKKEPSPQAQHFACSADAEMSLSQLHSRLDPRKRRIVPMLLLHFSLTSQLKWPIFKKSTTSPCFRRFASFAMGIFELFLRMLYFRTNQV